MNTPMVTLVRRELWEHREIWIAPLVVASLIILSTLAGAIAGLGHLSYGLSGDDASRQGALAVSLVAMSAPLYITMGFVVFFYLLDSLYTERRDRSILFWKSLPVSDTTTVLSKLLVALVLVPIGVFLVGVITDLVVAAIVEIRLATLDAGSIWDTVVWLKVRLSMLMGLVILALWYAPVVAWLLLVSAWARRNVFLWAVLPPLVAMLLERFIFETHYVAAWLGYRLGGVSKHFLAENDFSSLWKDGQLSNEHLTVMVGGLRALANVDLWLGVVAAAAFVLVAVQIRRYRDDT